jgi:tRNA 2-selenouridine synthase
VPIERLHIERFLELAKSSPVIDVRSPGEYKHAHIPWAYSLPLFTDEERKIVGTTYKQQSRENAIKVGLDIFGPKMRKMVEEVEKICDGRLQISDAGNNQSEIANLKSKIVLIYCWRGGMRSAGVAWLLDLYGFKVYTLTGGYKKYRNYVLDTFRLPLSLNILGGYTGSGKTDLLQELKKRNAAVIDLEGIAKHKGSAFGSIGMAVQPTQEMFENLLSSELRAASYEQEKEISNTPFREAGVKGQVSRVQGGIWLEDEAQRIGLINIPHELWKIMRQSPVYFLEIPFEERLQYLVREYGSLDRQKMLDAIGRISGKLGGLNAKMACEFLDEGNTLESFRILLNYYDKHYLKALHNREGLNSLLHTVDCKSVTPENASQLTFHTRPQPI